MELLSFFYDKEKNSHEASILKVINKCTVNRWNNACIINQLDNEEKKKKK